MLKCFNPECKWKPEFECSCTSPAIKLCSAHCGYHMNQNISLKHEITSIYIKLNSNDKNQLISFLHSQIESSKSIKAGILLKSKTYLTALDSLLSSLTNHEKTLQSLLVNASKHDRIIKNAFKNKENQIKYEDLGFSDQFLNEVNEINNSINYSEIKVRKALKNLGSGTNENNYELYFTVENSENLLFFNKNTWKVDNLTLNGLALKRWGAAVCDVSDGKVFVYGGSNKNDYFEDAYLIDLKTKIVEVLQPGIHRRQMSAEHINKKIYIFGGFAGYSMNQSSCFDLIEKNWLRISPFPSATRNTSTLSLESEILIAGQAVSLFCYEIIGDKYKEITANFEVLTQNVLVKFRDMIILITCQKIYVVESLNFSHAKVFENHVEFGTVSSKPSVLLQNDMAFFADYEGTVFMINCKTFKMKRLG